MQRLRNFITQTVFKFSQVLPKSFLFEAGHCLLPELLALFLNVGIVQAISGFSAHWPHFFFEKIRCNLNSALAFVLAYVGPCILDVGECTLIDCTRIGNCKLKQHLASNLLAIELLRLHFFEYLLPQLDRLLQKFRSEIFVLHFLKLLKLLLHFNRPHHGETVSIWENLFYQSSNPVFLLYPIRATLLLHECIFKILSRRDYIVLSVDKS